MVERVKILLVVGTRPEAIKLCPLYKVLESADEFEVQMCTTGQHREMLSQVLEVFDIEPAFAFDLMTTGQTLTGITIAILSSMNELYERYKPDLVVVQGDTTTAFAVSLSCHYHRISVAHVEAGLRTYRLDSPWPEEGNRQLISRLSSIHFAPTVEARQNLVSEHVDEAHLYVTGNTVIDALLWTVGRNKSHDSELSARIANLGYDIREFRRIILITGHRRENWGTGIENLADAISDLATTNPDVDFVYPVHMNPIVRDSVHRVLHGKSNVFLLEPLAYPEFVFLLSRCYLVLTDSGGIQEEAPSLGKPVLVFRDTTERPEGVRAGSVKLVGSEQRAIVDNVQILLDYQNVYHRMSGASNPYGDGTACRRILSILKEELKGSSAIHISQTNRVPT